MRLGTIKVPLMCLGLDLAQLDDGLIQIGEALFEGGRRALVATRRARAPAR